jgi:hypothetical protein
MAGIWPTKRHGMARKFSALLASAVKENRSYWYRWVEQRHDEIAKVFATQARPPWSALVKAAVESGAVDENGKPPTREALRKAFQRLEQDRARQSGSAPPRPTRQTTQPAPDPQPSAASAPEPKPAPPVSADPTRPPSLFTGWKPATLSSRAPRKDKS